MALLFSQRNCRWLGFVLITIAYACWSWASVSFPEVPLNWFYIALAISIAGWLLGFCNTSNQNRRFLLYTALVLHLIGVVGQPILEDDHYRFLWDGYQFAASGTPYGKAPEDYFNDPTVPSELQHIVGNINYPEIPTIYGATNQYVFLIAYWLAPAKITALQALLALFNLVLIWQMLKHAPVRYVLLYAWCPLVLKEIVFTTHIDGLGAGLLWLSAMSFSNRYGIRGAVLLALAVGVKVFAWLLVPFLLLRQRWFIWVLFISCCGLLYLPFLLQPGSEFSTLKIFAEEWQFNPALFAIVSQLFPPFTARAILAGCLGLFLFAYWVHYLRKTDNSPPRGDWIFAALLLVSPVLNAWYILWILPFAIMHRQIWPWVTAAALMLSYLTWLNLGNYANDPYALPTWVTYLQFSLIALAVGVDIQRWRILKQKAQEELLS